MHTLIPASTIAAALATKFRVDDATVSLVSDGCNDTYRVETERGLLFARVYKKNWVRERDAKAELDLLQKLADAGLSVVYPLQSNSGGNFEFVQAKEGRRILALFSNAEGEVRQFGLTEHNYYGRLLAKVHNACDQLAVDPRRYTVGFEHLVESPLRLTRKVMRMTPHGSFLKEVASTIRDRVEPLLQSQSWGVIYCDHKPENIHFDSRGVGTLFDFDCYGYGYRAIDLAFYLYRLEYLHRWLDMPAAKRKEIVARYWNEFLDGYCRERQPSSIELEAVRLLVPLCSYWVVGFHARRQVYLDSDVVTPQWIDGWVQFLKTTIDEYNI